MRVTPPRGDVATVSVFVAVPPDEAFDIFTREIDLWWRQGPRFRIAGRRRGTLAFEPFVGGRLFETFELSTGSRTIDVGLVTTWEPSMRLAFEWRGVNFAPNEKTFVEVTFAASRKGTNVTVRHYGWSALRDDHPVRHGLDAVEFIRTMGMWWGALMTSLRELVVERNAERDAERNGERDTDRSVQAEGHALASSDDAATNDDAATRE